MSPLDDLLGSRSLIISSHSNDAVLTRTLGEWSTISLRSPRGIAVGSTTAIVGSDGAHLFVGGMETALLAVNDIASHECAWAADSLLVCSPHRSAIVAPNVSGESIVWTVPGVDESSDARSWVNGLSVVDGALAYVTALGVSNTAAGWRAEAAASRGALIDARADEIVLHDLFLPHSPSAQADGSVLFLNSGHGQLCRWSGGSGFDVVATLNGWARGLAVADGHAFVGVSQGRTTAFPNLTVDPLAQPGIAVIDLASGALVDFAQLDVREVFAVVVS